MISQKILSITAVCELVGRNRRTLWAWVRDGVFPEPIKVHGALFPKSTIKPQLPQPQVTVTLGAF
jgi:predicted DNA-binding transcriptional regulator AlpA